MIIKRYIVDNMNEAMTRIRYELGKDAIIISQRKIKKSGFWGLFAKKSIEVTAAVDNAKKFNDDSMKESIEAIKKVVNEGKPVEKLSLIPNDKSKELSSNNDVIKEMQEMKAMMNEMMVNAPGKAPRKSKLQLFLEARDINEKLIKKICTKVKSVEGEFTEEEKLKKVVEKMINIAEPKLEGRIILVGPTGVGKTTTIAKLAGRLSLVDKKKVGLITIDTYRIGAVEQLKTYAEIMHLPFKVVITAKEMDSALESMKNCDIILVDTTGRSSKNSMQLSELRSFIEKVNSKNIHLVISCTTKDKDVQSIISGYKALNYNNIIITKLDETTSYGSILNIIDYAKKPLSFITLGQNVPEDIKYMTSEEVTNLILGEDKIC